jgi:hypothetical protein
VLPDPLSVILVPQHDSLDLEVEVITDDHEPQHERAQLVVFGEELPEPSLVLDEAYADPQSRREPCRSFPHALPPKRFAPEGHRRRSEALACEPSSSPGAHPGAHPFQHHRDVGPSDPYRTL